MSLKFRALALVCTIVFKRVSCDSTVLEFASLCASSLHSRTGIQQLTLLMGRSRLTCAASRSRPSVGQSQLTPTSYRCTPTDSTSFGSNSRNRSACTVPSLIMAISSTRLDRSEDDPPCRPSQPVRQEKGTTPQNHRDLRLSALSRRCVLASLPRKILVSPTFFFEARVRRIRKSQRRRLFRELELSPRRRPEP